MSSDNAFIRYLREEEKPSGYTRQDWRAVIDRYEQIVRRRTVGRIRARLNAGPPYGPPVADNIGAFHARILAILDEEDNGNG